MASPPSAEATLHPSFGAIGEARQAAIAARSTFFDERIRDRFSGLLWTAGTACTRCCRHAATAHARSCQAEIAADTPLPHRFLEEPGRIKNQTLNRSVCHSVRARRVDSGYFMTAAISWLRYPGVELL